MITITVYFLYNPFTNSKSDAQIVDIFVVNATLGFRVSAVTDTGDSRRGLVKKLSIRHTIKNSLQSVRSIRPI